MERPDLSPPGEVRRIVHTLEEAGFATWAVGGAVRDALAGRAPGDWDLTTAARPTDVQRLFRRTVPVGIDHGTVGVLGRDRRLYEVTTFRRDVQTFGRRAVVAFSDTLEEDLERRDFTINAVAWHPLTHEIRDPHGGRSDLAAGVLRTVGEPARRFHEDRLRVLRALRFAGRFQLRIDSATWSAAVDIAPGLRELSAERVREELLKVLGELPRPSEALRLYAASGALRDLYPELNACVGAEHDDGSGDLWDHLLRVTDAVPRHRVPLRLAALLHEVGRASSTEGEDATAGTSRLSDGADAAGAGAAIAREVLRRLKLSNAETDRAVHLIAHHEGFPPADASGAAIRHWLRIIGREYVHDLFRLRFAKCRVRDADPASPAQASAVGLYRRVRQVLSEDPPLTIGELAIGGAELRQLGLRPGPRYGKILRTLLERVLEDPALNTVDSLLGIVSEQLESAE